MEQDGKPPPPKAKGGVRWVSFDGEEESAPVEASGFSFVDVQQAAVVQAAIFVHRNPLDSAKALEGWVPGTLWQS